MFVFLLARFSYYFRIQFTHGDLYSVRFFRIILLYLISFVKVSQKNTEHWSVRVHQVNIDSFAAIIFSLSVLRARKSRNVCKCLSFCDCISSVVLRFHIPSTS